MKKKKFFKVFSMFVFISTILALSSCDLLDKLANLSLFPTSEESSPLSSSEELSSSEISHSHESSSSSFSAEEHVHKWNNGVITQEATCTSEGEKTYRCIICFETRVEKISKLTHKYETVVISPTCEAKGYTLHTCKYCGDNYKDVEKNHLSGEYTVVLKQLIRPEFNQKEFEFKELKPMVQKIREHYIFNLTKIFGASALEDLKQYVFTIQAKIENSSTYYTNSAVSEQYEFNKTQTLNAPTLSVELEAKSGKFIASWNAVDNAIGYEVELNDETIFVDNSTLNFLIEENAFTIKVRAVGAGNYITSNYSNSIIK